MIMIPKEKEVLKMKEMIFIDLDDTIAEFELGGGKEKMHEQGFFRNLAIKHQAKNTIHFLKYVYDGNIHILSMCIDTPYCKTEKMEWISEHLPFIKKENIHLIMGMSKADYVLEKFNLSTLENLTLIDDYKVNLIDWQNKGGRAIKFGKTIKQNRPYEQMNDWWVGLGLV